MGQEAFNLLFAHIPGMGFTAMVPNIPHDPIAIGLFGTIGIVVVSKDLADLIHKSEFGIRLKFFWIFHAISAIIQYMEK